MRAVLVSKRFNPGHVSHLLANAALFQSYGFDVCFSVHRKFLSFPDWKMKGRKFEIFNRPLLHEGDLFIVWFPSISVVFNLLFLKLLTRATTVYVYHEPYISFSSYRAAGFSLVKTLRITLISLVNWVICALSQKIILPSSRALDAVPKANKEPRRYAKINLIFADETRLETENLPREFISYIGTVAEDHAFDEFVRLVRGCITEQTLQPLRFLIATRSRVPERYRAVIDQCVSTGRLVLQSGSPMTNTQINRFYAQSFVVWNAYRRSIQSGVLPKAYMFGTPVLVSTRNQSEYFQNGIHGALISDHYTTQEFQQAIARLQTEWLVISQNCRNYYLNNFDYRALSSTFMNFLLDKT